jgi:tetratricopeptide (TPR) repeat protein
MNKVILLIGTLLFLIPGLSTATEKAELEDLLVFASGEERVDLLNKLAYEIKENETQQSVAHSTEALQLARELEYEQGEVTALNNLGIGHYFLADYARALNYYTESLGLAEQLGNQERSAAALNNIGIIHFLWGEYDQALDYYYRGLAIRESLGDELGIAKG